MSKITKGQHWQVRDSQSPQGAFGSLDVGQYITEVPESRIQGIWDERDDRGVFRVGRAIIRCVVLNSQADRAAGTVAYADGMTVPIDSKAGIREGSEIAARNPDHQIHLLDEIYNIDAETQKNLDPGLLTGRDSDFGPYGRLYADYFESTNQFPEVLIGHSLGARAMIALARDHRTTGSLKALSSSEPLGAKRMAWPLLNLGLARTSIAETVAISMDQLKDQSDNLQHFKDASKIPAEFLADIKHKANDGREFASIMWGLYRTIRGLGRAGLASEIEQVHQQHDDLRHYLWAGRYSFTVPFAAVETMYYQLPLEIRQRIQFAVADTRHNSGVAYPAKFAAQTAYVISDSTSR